MREISKAEKVAIIENNLRMLGQQFYDYEINFQVAKKLDEKASQERIEKEMAVILKKQDYFENLKKDLDKPETVA